MFDSGTGKPCTSRFFSSSTPHKQLVEDARAIFGRLLPRAFRRPVKVAEVEALVEVGQRSLLRCRPLGAASRKDEAKHYDSDSHDLLQSAMPLKASSCMSTKAPPLNSPSGATQDSSPMTL